MPAVRRQPGPRKPGPRAGVGPAVAAAVLGLLFAGVSLYWAVGGTALLDTVGGALEAQGRAGDPLLVVVVWVSVVLKVVAAILGLAVTLRWFDGVPDRLSRVTAWTAAVILTGYGAVLTGGGLLVVRGVIATGPDADLRAIRWHALFWDPWFLVWGVLLLTALIRFRRAARLR